MMNINRPFPRRCPICGKIDVYATTIRYKTARKVLGVLYEFETPDVIVNQCQTCKEYLIPQKTLDYVEEYFLSKILNQYNGKSFR